MISVGAEAKNRHPQTVGVLAEFRTPGELLGAAQSLRKAGYDRLDAFSPFPIHGMDDVLRIRKYPEIRDDPDYINRVNPPVSSAAYRRSLFSGGPTRSTILTSSAGSRCSACQQTFRSRSR